MRVVAGDRTGGLEAAYPLGFGLSYTSFAVDGLAAERTGPETATAHVRVTNTGSRDGRHVVQVYGTHPGDSERSLLGFAPVALASGTSTEVDVALSLRPLHRWDAGSKVLLLPEDTVVALAAGAYCGDSDSADLVLDLA